MIQAATPPNIVQNPSLHFHCQVYRMPTPKEAALVSSYDRCTSLSSRPLRSYFRPQIAWQVMGGRWMLHFGLPAPLNICLRAFQYALGRFHIGRGASLHPSEFYQRSGLWHSFGEQRLTWLKAAPPMAIGWGISG